MKILIDATSTQDQFCTRGIGRYTSELVTHMVAYSRRLKRDDSYYLLTFNSPTTLQDTIQKNHDLIHTLNIGKLRASDKLNILWWRTQYLPQIKKAIRDFSPDLYFAPYFWRGFPLGKLPVVVMIHDLALPILGKYSSAPLYLDWIRRFQYHNALRRVKRATEVLTNSETTKNDLLKYVKMPPERVKVIYLGISDNIKPVVPKRSVLERYLPSKVIDRGYILYYGGLEVNKNVANVVRAYAQLRKLRSGEAKDPALVLAGGDFTRLDLQNPLLAQIKDMVDEWGLEDHVYYTGYFENVDLPHLICAASLFVHLSRYEGFGFSPLEPMKCGIPVVASNRSCYPEILRDGALLVDPDDVNEVARVCAEVLYEKDIGRKLAESGRVVASQYTWDNTAKATYQLFSNIVGGTNNGKK